jgi:hypothetical protein
MQNSGYRSNASYPHLADTLSGAPVIQAGQIDFKVYKFVTTQTGGNTKLNLQSQQE